MFGINRRLDAIEHEVVKIHKLTAEMNIKLHAGSYCRESFGNCCTSENPEISNDVIFEKLNMIHGLLLELCEDKLKPTKKIAKPKGRPKKAKKIKKDLPDLT